jgi:hypothetical protein
MSENQSDRVARAVELLVFAPIGVGLYLRDLAPSVMKMFVARGRAEVDKRQEQVKQHVTTARSFGEVTVAFGLPMLRNKLTGQSAASPEAAPEPEPEAAPERPAPAPVFEPRPAPTLAPVVDAPPRGDLPIPGYDALSASQVVERLNGLAPLELDAVHKYETAHRQRRTILGKIEQLAG